mmetsp:Transcript_44560/g.110452  ORF Transcript_44560/g.110452 Transcript_44560/m.110452 type:complete len:110 (-) Transcript_44560:987-1316(-)
MLVRFCDMVVCAWSPKVEVAEQQAREDRRRRHLAELLQPLDERAEGLRLFSRAVEAVEPPRLVLNDQARTLTSASTLPLPTELNSIATGTRRKAFFSSGKQIGWGLCGF